MVVLEQGDSLHFYVFLPLQSDPFNCRTGFIELSSYFEVVNVQENKQEVMEAVAPPTMYNKHGGVTFHING